MRRKIPRVPSGQSRRLAAPRQNPDRLRGGFGGDGNLEKTLRHPGLLRDGCGRLCAPRRAVEKMGNRRLAFESPPRRAEVRGDPAPRGRPRNDARGHPASRSLPARSGGNRPDAEKPCATRRLSDRPPARSPDDARGLRTPPPDQAPANPHRRPNARHGP